jgi:hypothetical protein
MTNCLQNCEGKYTAIYHCDDKLTPHIVQEQVNFLETHSECAAVSTGAYLINGRSEVIANYQKSAYKNSKPFFILDSGVDIIKWVLLPGSSINMPSIMARSDVYKDKIKMLDPQYGRYSDLDLWIRLTEFGNFGILTKELMYYRRSKNSWSFSEGLRAEPSDEGISPMEDYLFNKGYIKLLPKYYINSYYFLEFKYTVIHNIKGLAYIGKTQKELAGRLFSKNVFFASFYSLFNMKIYCIGLVVFMLGSVKTPQFVRNYLKSAYNRRYGY